jgi:hypothetical protein
MSYKLGQDQLQWAKDQYAKDREVTDEVLDRVTRSLDDNQANAEEDRARWESEFRPLEDKLIAEADNYATKDKMDQNRGRAMGTVANQFDQTRQAALQSLEGFGVDPSSTRYAALDIGQRAAKAAAMAAAGNQSDQQTESVGRALRSEAINIGRGYPGQVASSYNTALQAGNQAVSGNLATTASGAQNMGNPTQWQGLGNQSVATWGNTLNQGYQNQLAAWNANKSQSSGIGSALGLIGGLGMKMFGFSEGGAVDDEMAEPMPEEGMDDGALPVDGGPVPVHTSPTGGGAIDDVPARLTVGEFVVPKDAVQWYGERHFQQLIKKARDEKAAAGAKPDVRLAPAEEPAFASGEGAIPV